MNKNDQRFDPVLQHKVSQLLSDPAGEMPVFTTEPAALICFFLALSKGHWHQGSVLLSQLNQYQLSKVLNEDRNGSEPDLPMPVIGGLLLRFYETALSPKVGLHFLEECFATVLSYHRYLYTHHDREENGLIHQKTRIDPFFQAILAWSNQALIQIGELLNKNITELVLWNELSVYSCQENLWDSDNSCFWQNVSGKIVIQKNIPALAFMPLFGNILTQEEAEEMLKKMQKLGYPLDESGEFPVHIDKHFSLSLPQCFILLLGLRHYDMEEAADCLGMYIQKKLAEKKPDWSEVAVGQLISDRILRRAFL